MSSGLKSRLKKTPSDRTSASFLLKTVNTKEFNFIKSEPSDRSRVGRSGARRVDPTPEAVFEIKERSKKLQNLRLGSGLKKATGLFARPPARETVESLHQTMLQIEVNMARPCPDHLSVQPVDRQRVSSRVQLVFVASQLTQPQASQRTCTESAAVMPSFEAKTSNYDASKEATPTNHTAAALEQPLLTRRRTSLSQEHRKIEAQTLHADHCLESAQKPASFAASLHQSAKDIHTHSSARQVSRPRSIKVNDQPLSGKSRTDSRQGEKLWRPLSPASFKKLKKYQFRIVDTNPQCDLKLVPQTTPGKQQPNAFISRFSTSNKSKDALLKRGYQLKKSETGSFQHFFDLNPKPAAAGKARRLVPNHSSQLKKIMRRLDGIIIKYEDARHNFFGEDYKPTLYETSFVHSGHLSDLQDPSVACSNLQAALQTGSLPTDPAARDLMMNSVNDQLEDLVSKCRVDSLKKPAIIRSSQLLKDSTPSSSKQLRIGQKSSQHLPHPLVSRFEPSTQEIQTQSTSSRPTGAPVQPTAKPGRVRAADSWKSILMTSSNLQLSNREAS